MNIASSRPTASFQPPCPAPSRWRDPVATPLMRLLGVRTDDPRIKRLKAALWQGDPLADAAALWLQRHRGGWQQFQQAVDHGIATLNDPAPELIAFFAQVEQRPDWVDDDLMRDGARAVLRSGLIGTTALGSVSLMIGYASAAAVKPLAMTGNLTGYARKRLSETSRWTVDCARSETLSRDSAGFRSTVRVRMMHAIVRQTLLKHPDWRLQDWGLPIMQHDMVATQLEFSTVFIAGCAAQGLVYGRHEREAIMHYYRYVCWLTGVDEALQPRTFREGLEVAALIAASSSQTPDADGIALTQGLFKAVHDGLADGGGPAWLQALLRYRAAAVTRLVLTDALSDQLQVPAITSKLPLLAGSAITLIADRALGLLPVTRLWRDRIGRQLFENALAPQNFGFVPTLAGKPLVTSSSADSA